MIRTKSFLREEKGFTMVELLVTITIIGVLAAIAIPRYAQYKAQAYDVETKANLRSLFLACKVYWIENGASSTCNTSVASSSSYGFITPLEVTVTGTGDENNFIATATHLESPGVTYTLDPNGNIS